MMMITISGIMIRIILEIMIGITLGIIIGVTLEIMMAIILGIMIRMENIPCYSWCPANHMDVRHCYECIVN